MKTISYCEKLRKMFPKLDPLDIEWIGEFNDHNYGEGYIDDFMVAAATNKLLILMEYNGTDKLQYEIIDKPKLAIVKAVIKVLHRRDVGMNGYRFIRGIIYKGRSLCFDDEKRMSGRGYYETGHGRNIKEVLK